jgi:hypothetical protein
VALREVIAVLGYAVDKASEQRINRSIGGVLKLAAGVTAAFGAAALAGVNQMLQQTAELGDNIAKTSKQLGINAQALQELRFAANLAGTSSEEMTIGLRRLQAAAKEAADGTKSYMEDFQALGIQVTDSNGRLKTAEELLFEVADGMNALDNETQKVALAQTLLGRSGTKMIPLLSLGSKGIREQTARARELGEVFDEELLAKSEDYIDAQRELQGASQGLRNLVAQQLLPIWAELTRGIADLIVQWRGPFKRAIDVGMRILSFFGRALEFVVERGRVLLPVLAGMAALLFPLPVLLLAVAAAALLVVEDLEVMAKGGESAIGKLLAAFKEWAAVTIGVSDETFGVIWEWLKIIGEAIVETFIQPLEAIPDLVEALVAPLKSVVELFENLVKLEAASFRAEQKVEAVLGEQAVAGISDLLLPGSSSLAAAGRQVGGPTITSSPTTTVNVNVTGTSDPEATGGAIAAQVEGVLERINRQAINAITVGSQG